MKKLSLILVLLLIVSLFPLQVLAADDNSDGYNDHDVACISAFLNQTSGGTTNAQKFGYASANDPATWSDVTWAIVGSEKRVQKINWDYEDTSGDLDLSGCTALTELYSPAIGLTSLNVSGCTALSILSCEQNELSSLDVSTCTALSELFCYGNVIETLNVSGCTSLTWLDCTENKLIQLNVNSCTNLKGLYCNYNLLSSLDVSGCSLENLLCSDNPLKHIYAVIEGEDITLNAPEGYLKLTYISYDVDGEKYIQRYAASAIPDAMPCSGWTGTHDSETFSSDDSNIDLELGHSYDINANFASGTVYNDHDVTKMQVFLNKEPMEEPNYLQLGYDVDDPSTWSDVTWVEAPEGLRLSSVQWSEGQVVGGTLDLSGCTYLESVDLYGNELHGLNLSGCTSLTSVSCINNYLDTLGLSGCNDLTSLKLNNNIGLLTTLSLNEYSNLEHLECIQSLIDTLELDGCTALKYLDCSNMYEYNGNSIKSLDVSGSKALTTLKCAGTPLTHINAFLNDTVVDLTAAGPGYVEVSYDGGEMAQAKALPNSSLFYCWNLEYGQMFTSETDINLYLNHEESCIFTANFVKSMTYNEHDVAKFREFLMQGSNALNMGCDINDPATWTTVNWGTAGDELRIMSFDWFNGNLAGPFDLSGCSSLKNVTIYNCQLGTVNVSGCTSLGSLNIDSCGLTSLDVSGCTQLRWLSCTNNSLTSLDLSGYTALQMLTCENNLLTRLNVNGCTGLEWLYSNNNEITSLDVSGCTGLIGLYCSDNALDELDVSDCSKLEALVCSLNSLTSLDVDNSTQFNYFVCSDNPLERLSAHIEGQDIALTGANGYVRLYYSYYIDEENDKHIEEFSATATSDSLPFTGWTGTEDGLPFASDTATVYLTPGSAYDLKANFGYAVVYDGNGANGGVVPDGGRYATGADITVSGNTGSLERTGYEFTGWNTAADGSGKTYNEGATLTITEESVTLYAAWAPIAYTITYDLDGGEADNPSDYTALTPAFTLVNPTKPGYMFAGWTGTGLSEAKMNVTITTGSEGDRSYTANWEQNIYNVTFNAQGGSDVNSIEVNPGEAIASAPVTTRFGYNFTGWFTETGTIIEFPYCPTDSVTLYAGWAKQPNTAYLSDIEISTGTLNKSFSKTRYAYLITLPQSAKSFTLTPIKEYDGALMMINGESVSSYTVNLSKNKNALISVIVKSGKNIRLYTFIVHKDSAKKSRPF